MACEYIRSRNMDQLQDAYPRFFGEVAADPKGPHGNTLLHIACQCGNKRAVKFLLKQGAQINAMNELGNTALHYCYANMFLDLAAYLESKDADGTLCNAEAQTPKECLGSSKMTYAPAPPPVTIPKSQHPRRRRASVIPVVPVVLQLPRENNQSTIRRQVSTKVIKPSGSLTDRKESKCTGLPGFVPQNSGLCAGSQSLRETGYLFGDNPGVPKLRRRNSLMERVSSANVVPISYLPGRKNKDEGQDLPMPELNPIISSARQMVVLSS